MCTSIYCACSSHYVKNRTADYSEAADPLTRIYLVEESIIQFFQTKKFQEASKNANMQFLHLLYLLEAEGKHIRVRQQLVQLQTHIRQFTAIEEVRNHIFSKRASKQFYKRQSATASILKEVIDFDELLNLSNINLIQVAGKIK